MLGTITKDNFAWIKRMDLGHCTCAMVINSVDASLKILLKDMELLQIIKVKEFLEYGPKIFSENFECLTTLHPFIFL